MAADPRPSADLCIKAVPGKMVAACPLPDDRAELRQAPLQAGQGVGGWVTTGNGEMGAARGSCLWPVASDPHPPPIPAVMGVRQCWAPIVTMALCIAATISS